MKVFGRYVAEFFFLLLFLLFLLLATVRFELLNVWFLSSSFERHQVYEELPLAFSQAMKNDPRLSVYDKENYAAITKSIKPSQVKSVFESNMTSVVKYLDGTSEDIVISVNPVALGILGQKLSWSLSESPQDIKIFAQYFHGSSTLLLVMVFAVFVGLVALAYVAGKTILLITGILTIILGGAGKFFLFVVTNSTPLREPSQVLAVYLFKSVLADIMISWILLGIALVAGWYFLKKRKKKNKRK